MEGNYDILVKELCKLPKETGWVEFKHNNDDPKMIGEDVCALANTATLKDHDFAYMIWGVDDTTHDIIGTSVRLVQLKKGQEDIENWLRHQLSRNANFEFLEAETDGKHIEIIRVHKVLHIPVAFEKTEYIRSGSYTKKLNDYPDVIGLDLKNHRPAVFQGLLKKLSKHIE
ncbi:MAG: ATP-binding protein [Bacteroidales bacterium]|nr:ATP-binding protein [Bacteroidales bacterium]